MKNYKISKIVKEDTTLEIVLDDDSKITQTVHGLPITGTEEEMTIAIKAYADAYAQGLGEETEASDEIKALVGQTIQAVKEI